MVIKIANYYQTRGLVYEIRALGEEVPQPGLRTLMVLDPLGDV